MFNIKTEDAIIGYIKCKPYDISNVPKVYRTERVWIKAVKQNPDLLSFCPDNEQTISIIMSAVKANGETIRFAKIQTLEIRTLAILNNVYSVGYMKDLEPILEELALSIQPNIFKLLDKNKINIDKALNGDIIKDVKCSICQYELLELIDIIGDNKEVYCRHCFYKYRLINKKRIKV